VSYPHLDENLDKIIRKGAQEIAYEYELDYVGTEHILLSILRHGRGLGARILTEYGVDEQRARDELDRVMQQAKEDTWVFGRLPGSPRYRNVVAQAIEEATKLEATEIGSEHILLALLREKNSTAQRVLKGLGVTYDKCRAKIVAHAAD